MLLAMTPRIVGHRGDTAPFVRPDLDRGDALDRAFAIPLSAVAGQSTGP